jgi:endogenous inhibitor of DNA gyrase (YacG/DUF329 family)
MVETLACPICKRPVPVGEDERPTTFPFCSARCRTIDLAAWATGSYVVPGKPVGDPGQQDDSQDQTPP